MTDLVVFAGLVGLVVVIGIFVGMIVAGRMDRVPPPRASTPSEEPPSAAATTTAEEDRT